VARGWPTCALILWLAVPAAAGTGREVSVALLWQSADGCLDTSSLHAAVRSRRRPVASAAEADAIISGHARRDAAGWQVELVVADRRGAVLGRRSLVVAGQGCEALREHVALVVAMLIDSSVVERAAPPRRAAHPPRREPRWRGDAGLGVFSEIGRLPGDETGLGATFGLTARDRWRGELELFASAEASAHDEVGETSIRWFAGSLAGCRHGRRRRPWQGFLCAGFETGIMRARGSGFARNQRDHKLLLDVVVKTRTELGLFGPTFLAVALTGRLAVFRPRFGYEDETGTFTPLYQPKIVAATFEAGLGVHFP
jgi:hypothetical protein